MLYSLQHPEIRFRRNKSYWYRCSYRYLNRLLDSSSVIGTYLRYMKVGYIRSPVWYWVFYPVGDECNNCVSTLKDSPSGYRPCGSHKSSRIWTHQLTHKKQRLQPYDNKNMKRSHISENNRCSLSTMWSVWW